MIFIRLCGPLGLLLLAVCLLSACRERGGEAVERWVRTDGERVRAALEKAVADSTAPGLLPNDPHRAARWERLRTLYRERQHEPVWTSQARRDALLQALCTAEAHGLDPGNYHTDRLATAIQQADAADADSLRAQRLAERDLLLSYLFLDYGEDLANGHLDPHAIEAAWHTQQPESDMPARLAEAARTGDVAGALQRLQPAHEGYRRLANALARLRQQRDEGGAGLLLPADADLERGDSSAVAGTLRRLLQQTGDLPADTTARPVFDDELAGALARFQERYGLASDSLLGENTIAALNTSLDEQIRRVRLNLERWRWLPNELGQEYILVNLPDYTLHAYRDGQEALAMRVVVGEQYEDRATPAFSDSMSYLEFAPYWNIPPGIAREEIVPEARRDPDYLADNDYEIVRTYGAEDALPVTTANLDAVENEQYRMRQRPGQQNALGSVKFMFPNDFDIYLHDTPATHLFSQRERAFSHGCIRVEKPVELARFVLPDSTWTTQRIEEMMNRERPEAVRLDEKIPVYILYFTAFVDDQGRLHFRNDLYGYDKPLEEALRHERTAPAVCTSLTQ